MDNLQHFNAAARATLLADLDAGVAPNAFIIRALCERLDAVEGMVRETGYPYEGSDYHNSLRCRFCHAEGNGYHGTRPVHKRSCLTLRPDIAALLAEGENNA